MSEGSCGENSRNVSLIEYKDGFAVKYVDDEGRTLYFSDLYKRFNQALTEISLIEKREVAEKVLEDVRENIDYYYHERNRVGTDEVIFFKAVNLALPGDILGRTYEPEMRLKRKLGDRMIEVKYDRYCIDGKIPVIIHSTYLLIFDTSNEEKMRSILTDIKQIGSGKDIRTSSVERRGSNTFGHGGWNEISLDDFEFLKSDCTMAMQIKKIKEEERAKRYSEEFSEDEEFCDDE